MTLCRPLPKPRPIRDKAYLAFIRRHDCVACGWPAYLGGIEAHHVETGGTGTKCSDYLTVSLCGSKGRGCHQAADKSSESVERFMPYVRQFNEKWVGMGKAMKEE